MSYTNLTTTAGAPVADNQNSLTAGPRGPVLLQDYHLHRCAVCPGRSRCVGPRDLVESRRALGQRSDAGEDCPGAQAPLRNKVVG
jgi:hypothetical protein